MKLAVFDFDGTLFPKDTLPFLLKQWKHLHCSRATYIKFFLSLVPLLLQYKLEFVTKLSREQMKVLAVRKFNKIFAGKTEKDLIQFFDLCAEEMVQILNPAVVQEVKAAQAEGYHTVLLSGTYDYLLNYIGKDIGFDTVIGSKMAIINGVFDPGVETEIVIGEAKLRKIYELFPKESVDWEASIAYADGYSDLNLLEAVGQPVAVRPDAELKPIALKRQWKIVG